MSLWIPVRDGDTRALWLYRRHYSCKPYKDGRRAPGTYGFVRKIIGPGEYLLLLTVTCDAVFSWKRFIDASGQDGVNCAVFRNEGPLLSSSLILDAEQWAWDKWPGERLYTYVDPRRVSSRNPGYCFKSAGWRHCGKTAGGLHVLEKVLV